MRESRTGSWGVKSRAWRAVAGAMAGASLVFASMTASPMQSGNTAQGLAFATGGVSKEELATFYASREKYSLWIVTAALGSGAHLADVRVVIRDAEGQVAYDGRLQDPWLFINLPLGRCEVEATVGKETHKRITTIHAGDLHQAFFYFATGDELSPEYRSPFPGSPYVGKRS